ncbi:glycoside hydrolase [Thraustotheca clavata]|uniref:Glycoside hydrolase n=1 Tax=Thraustotheca clavata TaxID=74557 RepID=A0A1V9Z3B2_9STRA|nr:glycoside hydrolase [Thraustotheca clavata]
MKLPLLLSALVCLQEAINAINPVVIKGQRMFVYSTGSPFLVKGVDYYPRPNAGILDINNYDFFTDENEEIWRPHIQQFQELGVNAIRLYAVDPSQSHDKFMCALEAIGVYVLVDLAASCTDCAITKEPYPQCYPGALKTRGQQIIVAFSKYNNVLGFSAGNEVNNVVNDSPINAPCQKKFIRDMRAFIHSCQSKMRPIPVGVVLADFQRKSNAAYYNCRTNSSDTLENVEWYGLNAYVQCDPAAPLSTVGPGYAALLSDFKSLNMSVPVMLTEYGCLNVGYSTVSGYQAQRTWADASWMLSSSFNDIFTGGFAFEFSTENANSKADSPYPFTKYGTQNYGLGYFSPETCDGRATPCIYNRMPNYGFLATQYNASTGSQLAVSSQYTGYRTVPPACPTGFAAISNSTWASDSVTDMLCPDLTATTLCPGDVIIAGTGTTVAPGATYSPASPGTSSTPAPSPNGGANAQQQSSDANTNTILGSIAVATTYQMMHNEVDTPRGPSRRIKLWASLLGFWMVAGICRMWYLAGFFNVDMPNIPAREYAITEDKMAFIVYSSMWQESFFAERITAIRETWAQTIPHLYCVQTKTPEYQLPASTQARTKTEPGFKLLVPPASQAATPVTFAINKVAEEAPYHQWFYLAADSSYVIPANLIHLVQGLDPNEPYFLGHPLLLPTSGQYSWPKLNRLVFNSMAGLLLSKGAVEEYKIAVVNGCYDRCVSCGEDLKIAFCLRERGIFALDTRDEITSRDVFHIFSPGSLVNNARTNGTYDYTPANCDWYQLYSMWPIQMNLDCCSSHSALFHYTNAEEIRAIHTMLYQVAPHVPKDVEVNDVMLRDLIKIHAKHLYKQFPSYTHPAYSRVRHLLLRQIQISHSWDSSHVNIRNIDDQTRENAGQKGVVT